MDAGLDDVMGKTPKQKSVDALYRAVQKYVELNGGKLIVVGGIQVQQWLGDAKYNFVVAVRCTGVLPEFAKEISNG